LADFFKRLMGMKEVARQNESVYLRCAVEYYQSSLVLTTGAQLALGHIGWRAEGPEELEIAVKQIEATSRGEGWVEGSVGHDRAYRFRAPGAISWTPSQGSISMYRNTSMPDSMTESFPLAAE
jgi:catechol 2,3-dioxygenase